MFPISPAHLRPQLLRRCRIVLGVMLAMATVSGSNLATAQRRSDPDGLSRTELRQVERWTERLVDEVESLQGMIRRELPPPAQRQLYAQTDDVLDAAYRFQRELNARDFDDAARRFERLDQQVHELLASVRGPTTRNIAASVRNVKYADQQLHFALTGRDPRRAGQVLERQAELLADEADELRDTARFALANNPRGREIERHIDDYANAARRFARSLDNDRRAVRIADDFTRMDREWRDLIRGLNALSARELVFVRRRADRVGSLHANLVQLLLPGTTPISITYP